MDFKCKFKNKVQYVKSLGFCKCLQLQAQRYFLSLLRLCYGFDKWHVDSPLLARPYRYTVAETVNDLSPESVIEVGCGLGTLLSLIKAPTRTGYDIDDGVIRAAKLLNSRKIHFVHGSIEAIPTKPVDIVIMVNWIHDVNPKLLQAWLAKLLSYTSFLIVDAIDQTNPLPYAYKHDFVFLQDRCRLLKIERHPGEGRSFLLFEVL